MAQTSVREPARAQSPPANHDNIPWRHSLEEAKKEAREQGKLLLIDLFNPK